jgi:hypothetical protein
MTNILRSLSGMPPYEVKVEKEEPKEAGPEKKLPEIDDLKQEEEQERVVTEEVSAENIQSD